MNSVFNYWLCGQLADFVVKISGIEFRNHASFFTSVLHYALFPCCMPCSCVSKFIEIFHHARLFWTRIATDALCTGFSPPLFAGTKKPLINRFLRTFETSAQRGTMAVLIEAQINMQRLWRGAERDYCLKIRQSSLSAIYSVMKVGSLGTKYIDSV